MKRAQEPSPAQLQTQAKKFPPPASPQKETPTPGFPEKKPSAQVETTVKDEKPSVAAKPEDKPHPVVESQKSTTVPTTQQPAREGQKEQKPAQPQIAKAVLSLAKSGPKEESGLFGFGFGGARSRSPSPQTVASAVSVKDQKAAMTATPEESQKSTAVPSTQQPVQPQKVEPSKVESSFFGFGGARSRSPSPQTAASAVSGKVLGFGSSFLSSASNLISSAVQDEPSTTPPTSRKGSTVSERIPPTPPRRASVSVEPDKVLKGTKTKTSEETKPLATKKADEKAAGEATKVSAPSKAQHVTCPLCKQELNVGSKEDPNYNTCTECKNMVCNLCGFNPVPHQTEVRFLYFSSNLISLAVQDEPPTTPPPSSRKGSSVSQSSIKSPTPPASRKGSEVSQTSGKTPPASRKDSAASQVSVKSPPAGVQTIDAKEPDQKPDVKVDETQDSAKPSAPSQPTPKPTQSSCPICKVELNMGSGNPPNFNICTECKNNVCSQCGFDPMPHQTKVRNYCVLCLYVQHRDT
ncbi:protein piccolo-like [Astyanax mexicanus]|uniref:Protein piccolo-like n=1 Tax=Astyanax mexicanus TaxID=7994 RepID=A0A8T2LQD5_ASTMX|nr:protein piccolo-like [Astyanax mexicanus]